MNTAKDLELLLLIKEHEKQKLQLKINQAIDFLNRTDIDYNDSNYWLKNCLLDILEGEENEASKN